MRELLKWYASGAVVLWIVSYFVASFIVADMNWMRGMFTTWGGFDRAAFLVSSICVTYPAAIFAMAISNERWP